MPPTQPQQAAPQMTPQPAAHAPVQAQPSPLNPQTPGAVPLDPQVVSLARAIRTTESNGNFYAVGSSGERGAYQWMPDTWKSHAQQYLNNPNAPMTPSNQNAVAYLAIKDMKDKGMNPAEIAASWNSGTAKNWQTAAGTNAQGVEYNVPDYVKKVTDLYQSYKTNPPDSLSSPNDPQKPIDRRDWLAKSADFMSSIFPGKQIGESIGTLGGYIYSKAYDALHGTNYSENYDLSAPTPLQTTADAAQALLMVGAGMPEGSVSVFGKSIPTLATPATAVGRIAQNAAIGAGFGATGAVANGAQSPTEIASQTGLGTFFGGAAGLLGEGFAKAADSLPKSIVQRLLPQLQKEGTLQYAIDNTKLGTTESMLDASNRALKSYDSQVSAILEHPNYQVPTGADVVPTALRVTADGVMNGEKFGDSTIRGTLNAFPNSEYTSKTVFDKMRTLVPSQAATITKLEDGSISLQEANELRSAVDRITYKTKIDSPEVRAGKDLAAAFGNALRSQVQTKASETAGIFSNYSKEISLNQALRKLASKEDRKKVINFKELMGIFLAHSVAGLPGALATGALEKVAESPAVRMGTAKAIDAAAPALRSAASVVPRAGAMAATLPSKSIPEGQASP